MILFLRNYYLLLLILIPMSASAVDWPLDHGKKLQRYMVGVLTPEEVKELTVDDITDMIKLKVVMEEMKNEMKTSGHGNSMLLYDVFLKRIIENMEIAKIGDVGEIAEIGISDKRDGPKLLEEGINKVRSKRIVERFVEIYSLEDDANVIRCIAFSPNGKYLALGSRNGTIKILDATSWTKREPLTTLIGHVDVVETLAFSSDGNYLASGSWDKTINIWDAKDWTKSKPITTLTEHIGYVSSVAFSPDGNYLASGSDDASIKIWNAKNWRIGRSITTLDGHDIWTKVVFHPDGNYLASGGDEKIKIWDVNSWNENGLIPKLKRFFNKLRPITVLKSNEGDIDNLVFSPNGSYLAGRAGRTITAWDARNWGNSDPVFVLTGNANDFFKMAFSPDWKYLASGSRDEVIKIWKVKNCKNNKNGKDNPIVTLTGTNFLIQSIVFSPDGKYLVLGSHGVKIWEVIYVGGK